MQQREKKQYTLPLYLPMMRNMMLSAMKGRTISVCGNTTTQRILILMIALSLTGLLAGVESFHPTSLSAVSKQHGGSTLDLPRRCHQTRIRSRTHHQNWNRQQVFLKASEDDADTIGGGILGSIGLVSQPIVWISLYSLATTGHGLPAGPGGSIGAVEGLAYLVVVVLAILPTKNETDESLAKTLSRTSIALGLLVLAGVAAGKGCVPNAKPILDYSAYLPVCGPE